MDRREFEERYKECESAVKRLAYYKMPTEADADDVIQEALLSAFQNRENVKSVKSFKPWLLRIVSNKCNDFYRQRGRRSEISLDIYPENILVQSRYGYSINDAVQDTLNELSERDSEILRLFFIENMPQSEISCMLGIPIGTVKSRLHTAKKHFQSIHPHSNTVRAKGEKIMNKLPKTMPDYSIRRAESEPFSVKWEELMGWFIVPRMGEKLAWAMYGFPERTCTESYDMEVIGRTRIHDIEGVEIIAHENRGGEHEGYQESRTLTRTFVAQLTDTHCRLLAESHYKNGVKHFYTFLDADEFLPNWGFGEDNCGKEINLVEKGSIARSENIITTSQSMDSTAFLDIVGRYTVCIGGKEYDCVCVMDIESYNSGVATEQFIDKNGRTVLWRRFNKNDWHFKTYGQLWTEKLPDNEQLIINGETYVHWYDCITDYIFFKDS